MYILVIAGGYPSCKTPLSGIFEFDQAKALRDLGHKVIFVSIDMRSLRRFRKWGKSHFFQEGIEIYNISLPLGSVPARWMIFFGQCGLQFLYKKICAKHEPPDIVHAHFTPTAAIASILKVKYHLPFIVTEHSSALNVDVLTKSSINYAMQAYLFADALITVSSTLAKKIQRHFGLKSIVIHNIVDITSFDKTDIKKTDTFTFISVGNLIYGKGFDLLIDAFANAQLPKNVFLLIIGEGKCRNELQERIDRLGLSSQIKLLGFLPRTQIAEIMNNSHVFVLATRRETFGVAYIEAMLMGLPVIATICGGPEDFVHKEQGLLIPTENVSALTDALQTMYATWSNYNKEQISAYCRREFSPEKIGRKLLSVYEEVLVNTNNKIQGE